MTIGTTTRNDVLQLIYNAVAIANLADNAATTPATTLYVALHSADPNSGDQLTSEAAYTGYTRIGVTRSGAGWVVTTNSVSPANPITFPTGTAGGETITHASVGMAASGASKILDSGVLSPSMVTGNGITPELKVTSTITRV